MKRSNGNGWHENGNGNGHNGRKSRGNRRPSWEKTGQDHRDRPGSERSFSINTFMVSASHPTENPRNSGNGGHRKRNGSRERNDSNETSTLPPNGKLVSISPYKPLLDFDWNTEPETETPKKTPTTIL